MNWKFRINISLFFCLVFALTACGLPGERTWEASPVLIRLEWMAGFTDYEYAWSVAPSLLIYADGQVFDGRMQARISQDELCNLLFQIEASGFYELEQSDYVDPEITDMGTLFFIVNTWRKKGIRAYAFGMGEVPPALQKTSNLINNLPLSDRTTYQPDRVAILIRESRIDFPTIPWPLSEPSLVELAPEWELYKRDVELLLEGPEAKAVFDIFQGENVIQFIDQGQIFLVTIRPMFPYEVWKESEGWSALSTFETSPTTEMTCSK